MISINNKCYQELSPHMSRSNDYMRKVLIGNKCGRSDGGVKSSGRETRVRRKWQEAVMAYSSGYIIEQCEIA